MSKPPEGFEPIGVDTSSLEGKNIRQIPGFSEIEYDPGPIVHPQNGNADQRPGGASQAEFVRTVEPAARRVAQRLNVPVEAVIGQWGLETGWGKSVIPGTNNYGNIKDFSGKGVAATDNMNGSRDKYRAYSSLDDFADDYANLIGSNGRYKGAVGAANTQQFFSALKQGGYAEDPNYAQSGVAASASAAKHLQQKTPAAPSQQNSAELPDLTGIPKWREIATSEKFSKLPDSEKSRVKNAYFDELMAPYVAAEGSDVAAEKAKFIGAQNPRPAGLASRAGDAIKSAAGTIWEADKVIAQGLYDNLVPSTIRGVVDRAQKPDSIMSAVDGQSPGGVSASTLPLNPKARAQLEVAYNSSSPDQRLSIAKQPSVAGSFFDAKNKEYAPQDQNNAALSQVSGGVLRTSDLVDPRVESRANRLIAEGADASAAQSRAQTLARFGVAPGADGSISKSDFDFETQEAYKNSSPVIRAAVKGYEGYKQANLGILQAVAEAAGADDIAKGYAKGGADAQRTIDAIGDPENRGSRAFEGAVTSIAQQLPILLAGAVTGSETLVLSNMAVQSFGQEYLQGRAKGLEKTDAGERASLFAAFEVIGEKFGLGNTLNAIKMSASGAPTKALISELAKGLAKEIPGEVLTTTGQFVTDKSEKFGLNQQAGWEDYLSQVADTISTTVLQSGMMMGGASGVSAMARRVSQFSRPRVTDAAPRVEPDFNAFHDPGLGTSAQNPSAPNVAAGAPNIQQAAPAPAARAEHPTEQLANSIVREMAEQSGLPVEMLLPASEIAPLAQAPVPTPVHQPTQQNDLQQTEAPQDGLADQHQADQSPEAREVALWIKASDGTITPEEQAELSSLQQQAIRQGQQTQEDAQGGTEQASHGAVAGQRIENSGAVEEGVFSDQPALPGSSAGQVESVPEGNPLPNDASLTEQKPRTEKEARELRARLKAEAENAAAIQGQAANDETARQAPLPRTEREARAMRSSGAPVDLLTFVNRNGGIASSLKSDIDQDAKLPGLFRKNGRSIDSLAELLEQHGYIGQNDIEAEGATSGGDLAMGMIRRAVGGERIYTPHGYEEVAARQAEAQHRELIRSRAKSLGINPIGKNAEKLAEMVEAEISRREAKESAEREALTEESRGLAEAMDQLVELFSASAPVVKWAMERAAQIAKETDAARRKAGYDAMSGAIKALVEKRQGEIAHADQQIEDSFNEHTTAAREDSGGSSEEPRRDDAGTAREGAGSRIENDRNQSDEGFALENQTEQDLAKKVARENDQDLADKLTADAQRDAFTLDAQTGGFAQNTMQQGGDLFSQPDVSEKAEKVSTSAEPVQKTAKIEQVSASAESSLNQEAAPADSTKSKPDQEAKPAQGKASGESVAETKVADQEKTAAQAWREATAKQVGEIMREARVNERYANSDYVAMPEDVQRRIAFTMQRLGMKVKNPQAPVSGPVAYRNEAGETWSGRGRKPQWVADHLAAGGTLEQIAVTQEIPSARAETTAKQLETVRAAQESSVTRDYVRLQNFDHPTVGVLNNLRAQKDAAWATVKKLKAQVRDGRNDLRVKLIQAESAHKDLVRQESSARESVEEAANAQGLTTYKPSPDEPSAPMFSRSESRTPPTTDVEGMRSTPISKANKLATVFSAIGKFEDAFQRETPQSTSMEDIAHEVMPGVTVKKLNEDLPEEWDTSGVPDTWEISTKDSGVRSGRFMSDGKHVWIDVSGLLPGKDLGSAMYAIASAYAYNNGQVFIGDPAGLSPVAFFRRLENMISSAIKYGTTDHLYPHPAQMNPETYFAKQHPDFAKAVEGLGLQWKQGDFDFNLKQMLLTSYNAAKRFMPGIEDIEYDFANGGFRRVSDDARVDRAYLKNLLRKDVGNGPEAGERYYAGSATAARAILTQSISRSQGAEAWSEILAGLRSQLRGRRLDQSLEKIFYSKSQEQIAREQFGNPNPKSTVEQVVKELGNQVRLGGKINVVQSALDLPAEERRQVFSSSHGDRGLQGVFFPDTGRSYLIADNLEPGEAFSTIMHEAGVHAGLRGLIGERGMNTLAVQIKGWARAGEGDQGRIAKKAASRIPEGTKDKNRDEELIAYFVTEAVKDGYGEPKPTASNAIERWFARLWSMVKAAIQKLDVKPESLTVDDIVALARGALERIDSERAGADGSQGLRPQYADLAGGSNAQTSGALPHQAALGLKGGATAGAWDIGAPSRMDNFIHAIQDRHVNLKRVQKAISESDVIPESFDAYTKESLYHGRVATRAHKFLDREMKPLLMDMKLKGVSMDELESFLWARHAKERNEQIRKINADMPDGGSGLTDAQVDAYLGGKDVLDSDGKLIVKGLSQDAAHQKRIKALAARVDAINAGTKQVLVQYGLETPETIAAWESTYQHYVPLQREEMEGATPIGQGFSVKGDASKRAMGSSKRVENILANLALQREAAITRGEKNRVALSVYGLALQNPNPDFWQVDKAPVRRVIDKKSGLVTDAINPNYKNQPNVLSVRIGGRDHAIVFNEHNERAAEVVESLKNLDVEQLNAAVRGIAYVTRYFASISTQYNPVFGIMNGIRDTWSAALNLTSTPIAGKQLAVLKNVPMAIRAIWRIENGKTAGNDFDDLYEAMRDDGGTTGYREVFRTGSDRAEALREELGAMDAGFAKRAARAVLETLDRYNTSIENATRLSAYKVARENGLTREASASLSKELTVNFNRKGKYGSFMGGLYAFFNAAVQGNARLLETLRGPAGARIFVGGVVLGIIQALIARAGFDDEKWEDVSEFEKQRNFIIPTGGGDYAKIPLPLGFNLLPTIGRDVAEMMLTGGKNAGTQFSSLFSAFIDSANPLGNATALQTFAPSIADIPAALYENKNFMGSPIAKEDANPNRPTPGFTRAKDSSSHLSRMLSDWINAAAGGTDYTPGQVGALIVSPTPDQLDYLFGGLTGGIGREANKLYKFAEKKLEGEEPKRRETPVFGNFFGTTNDDMLTSARFWRNVRELGTLENELKGRVRDRGEIEALFNEKPEAKIVKQADRIETQISKMRRNRHQIEFDERLPEDERTAQLKEMDEAILQRMEGFNKMVREAKRGDAQD